MAMVIVYGPAVLGIGFVWSKFGVFGAFAFVVIWFALGGIAALVTYLVPFLRYEQMKSLEVSRDRLHKRLIAVGLDPSGHVERLTMQYAYENLVLVGPFGFLGVLSRVLFGKSGR